MVDQLSLNGWLDLWEEQVENAGQRPNLDNFVAQNCQGATPQLVAEFIQVVRRLDRINARISPAAASVTTSLPEGSDTDNPLASNFASPLLPAGAEPVPGYVLQSPLGRGGFGEVWKATGPGGHEVALKFVRLDRHLGDAELRAVGLMKHVRHPNLISLHGSWQVDGWLILAMDLAERSLMDRFREVREKSSAPGIPANELIRYMEDAARAIDFLNEPRHPGVGGARTGIQHRDIKPQNLLLQGGGVRVADFGLAKCVEEQTGHTGYSTPAFAAPETFDHRTTSRSDQYSLAVTYCFLRTGRLPFEGTGLQIMKGHIEMAPDLSMLPFLESQVVGQALAKDPRKRWRDCRTFVGELRTMQGREELWRSTSERIEPAAEEPVKVLPATNSHDDGWESFNRKLFLQALVTFCVSILAIWLISYLVANFD